MNRERVGDQLVEAKVVSSDDLAQALTIQRAEGGRLGSILVRMGVLSESTLLEFLSQQYGVPTIDLSTCALDHALLAILPLSLVQQHLVVPVQKTASRLTLAMADPTNASLLDELRFRTGLPITPMVATESDICTTIRQAYDRPQNGSSSNGTISAGFGKINSEASQGGRQPAIAPPKFDRGQDPKPGLDAHSASVAK
ncbi:MAG: hypothetical protein OEY91_09495, partial [Nitrospirota bacterium]|nr:hypothetical protein [Nitrospirota bacterium]